MPPYEAVERITTINVKGIGQSDAYAEKAVILEGV
jgi:hypothetical protein